MPSLEPTEETMIDDEIVQNFLVYSDTDRMTGEWNVSEMAQ